MKPFAQVVDAAVAGGVLPGDAAAVLQEAEHSQPWPVVLVGFIGAQFAVWPIFVFLAMIGEGFMFKSAGPYITGALMMVAGCVLLRGKAGAGFLSHIAFTTVLTGDAMFCYGLMRDLHSAQSIALPALLVCALQIGLALAIRVRWSQALLGAIACMAFLAIGVYSGRDVFNLAQAWWVLIGAAGLWAGVALTQPYWSAKPFAAALDSLALGWCVALLLGLVSNTGFSASLLLGVGVSGAGYSRFSTVPILAVLVTFASGAFLWRRWAAQANAAISGTAQALLALAFIALAVFSWFVPSIAAFAVVCAAALLSGHTRLFGFALLVLASQLSGFYYSLAFTLVDKALLLIATGAVLLLSIFIITKLSKSASKTGAVGPIQKATTAKNSLIFILMGAAVAFAAINWNIVQKERVISQGQRLYVALAPRDPRSLMQGDYMALNFDLPFEVRKQLGGNRRSRASDDEVDPLPLDRRASVVAWVDARGVASVRRVANKNEALAVGEVLLPVQFKSGNWALVTDAFFFPEGKGKSLEAARFGELRALSNGQALLVGLADDKLVTIKPVADKPASDGAAVEVRP